MRTTRSCPHEPSRRFRLIWRGVYAPSLKVISFIFLLRTFDFPKGTSLDLVPKFIRPYRNELLDSLKQRGIYNVFRSSLLRQTTIDCSLDDARKRCPILATKVRSGLSRGYWHTGDPTRMRYSKFSGPRPMASWPVGALLRPEASPRPWSSSSCKPSAARRRHHRRHLQLPTPSVRTHLQTFLIKETWKWLLGMNHCWG